MAPTVPTDLTEKSILHLHAASQTLLPINQPLSSHMATKLLEAAIDNDINLPESFLTTRVCQRCGTLCVPGVTCTVRARRSRRQKRRALGKVWLVYECLVCKYVSKSEVEGPVVKKEGGAEIPSLREKTELRTGNGKGSDVGVERQGGKKRRSKLEGLRSAVEKARTARTAASFDLMDLMKLE